MEEGRPQGREGGPRAPDPAADCKLGTGRAWMAGKGPDAGDVLWLRQGSGQSRSPGVGGGSGADWPTTQGCVRSRTEACGDGTPRTVPRSGPASQLQPPTCLPLHPRLRSDGPPGPDTTRSRGDSGTSPLRPGLCSPRRRCSRGRKGPPGDGSSFREVPTGVRQPPGRPPQDCASRTVSSLPGCASSSLQPTPRDARLWSPLTRSSNLGSTFQRVPDLSECLGFAACNTGQTHPPRGVNRAGHLEEGHRQADAVPV